MDGSHPLEPPGGGDQVDQAQVGQPRHRAGRQHPQGFLITPRRRHRRGGAEQQLVAAHLFAGGGVSLLGFDDRPHRGAEQCHLIEVARRRLIAREINGEHADGLHHADQGDRDDGPDPDPLKSVQIGEQFRAVGQPQAHDLPGDPAGAGQSLSRATDDAER